MPPERPHSPDVEPLQKTSRFDSAESIAGLRLLVVRINPEGLISYASTAFFKTFALSKDELLGKDAKVLRQILPSVMGPLIADLGSHETREEVLRDDQGKVWSVAATMRAGFTDLILEDVTEQEELRNYVRRYTSLRLDQLSEDDLRTFRFPERRWMTVSFADLRGFTAMSEKLTPEQVRTTINAYLDAMIEVVEEYGATVDKIVGDEVMALYGAPAYYADHAFRALMVCCEQVKRMEQLMQQFTARGEAMPGCGIGINTGDMVLGNIGGQHRMDYTVLGAAVNLAARLCGGAQTGEVVLTETTLKAIRDKLPEGWDCIEKHEQSTAHELATPTGKVESVLPLPAELQGKYFLLGQTGQPPAYRIAYRCCMQVKGVEAPLPILVAEALGKAAVESNSPRFLNTELVQGETERVFGKYRLLEKIGVGGMGEVWRSRDAFGNEVAVKLLLAGENASEDQIKRLKREAEVLAKLSHRNICRIFEVGQYEGTHYIAMELVDGVPLDTFIEIGNRSEDRNTDITFLIKHATATRSRILSVEKQSLELDTEAHKAPVRRSGKGEGRSLLPIPQVLKLMQQVCEAVHYAHSHGILHRDLKPGNILLRLNGDPVLVDFGLAKFSAEGQQSVLLTGMVAGTVDYMPPEQALDSSGVTERSDVYSLGAILYELLSGSRHFGSSGNLVNDMARLQDHEPASPRILNPKLDRDLATITLKAIQPDMRMRYANASQFADDIHRYENGDPIVARRPTLAYRAQKFVRKFPIPVTLVTILILLSSIFGIHQYVQYLKQWGDWIPVSDWHFASDQPIDLAEEFEFYRANLSSPAQPWQRSEKGLRVSWNQLMMPRNIHIRGDVRVVAEISIAGVPDGFDIFLNSANKQPGSSLPPSYLAQFAGYQGKYDLITVNTGHSSHSLNNAVNTHYRSEKQHYTITFENNDGFLNLYVDGKRVHQLYEPLPMAGLDLDRILFRGYATEAYIERIRIYRKALPELASPLQVPRALLIAGQTGDSVANLLNIIADYTSPRLKREAAFAAYLTIRNYALEDYVEALPTLFDAVQTHGGTPAMLARMREADALAYWLVGDWQAALASVSDALRAAPDSRIANRLISARSRDVPEDVAHKLLVFLGKTQNLSVVQLENLPVRDLEPLRNLQLRFFSSYNFLGDSLEPLKTHPLKYLHISARGGNFKSFPEGNSWALEYLSIAGGKLNSLAHINSTKLTVVTSQRTPLTKIDLKYGLGEAKRLQFNDTDLHRLDFMDSVKNLDFLELRGNPLKSVSALQGKHIRSLNISFTNCETLMGLETVRGLEVLNLNSTFVTDLSPLEGKKLKNLGINNTPIVSLEPLRGQPIQRLHACLTQVRDLSPIEALPLNHLALTGSPITSLGAFIENPPRNFSFFCPSLPEEALEQALEYWTLHFPERTDLHRQARLILAYKRQDYTAMRRQGIAINGKDYLAIPGMVPYGYASALAQELGGKLLSLETPEKIRDIKNNHFGSHIWVAMIRDAEGNRWHDGTRVDDLDIDASSRRITPYQRYPYAIWGGNSFVPARSNQLASIVIEWEDSVQAPKPTP